MSYDKKEYITWEDFHAKTLELCQQLKQEGKTYVGIVVVTRGGLLPASIISSQLNIRNIETLAISSYSNGDSALKELQVIVKPQQALQSQGEGWLVVDELVDSGRTIQYIKEILPKAQTVAIYTKNKGQGTSPDKYIKYVTPDTWLCLPWSVYDF